MHTKLNYTQTINLFRTISEKHKTIKSFVEIDLEEIKDVVKSAEDLPALVFTSFKEGMFGAKADNNQSSKRCYFAVIKRYSSKSHDSKTKHQLIDDSRLHAIDIITYLRREKLQNRLPGYDPNSVSDGGAVFNKDDGFIGWEFSLKIDTPINLAFNPENWNL